MNQPSCSRKLPLRSLSFTASTVLAATAILTSTATAITAQTYTGATLNGTTVDGTTHIATPAPSSKTKVAQYPIAVAANHAGSYVVGSKIKFYGKYGGVDVIRTATVVGTDGNATFVADGPLNSCSKVTIEAQTDALGAWTLGWNDIACPCPTGDLQPFRKLIATSSGDLMVQFGDGSTDTLKSLTATSAAEDIEIVRLVFSNAATTITTLRLYE
jgi:hypothetical protein